VPIHNLTRFVARPAFVVFNAGPISAARLYAETVELVNEIGMQVAPVRLSERAPFRHATGSGKAVQETEPLGKAAQEVADLWVWICKQINMPARTRVDTSAKVPA
jgi:chromosome partitioning protein